MMTVLQQEMSLVSDLLYLLIGIEGQHIKADPLDSANAERTFKIEVCKMVTLTIPVSKFLLFGAQLAVKVCIENHH